jgi:hypothetical protein
MMNDLIYIIKLCGEAIIILLAIEIAFYLFANRKDQSKGSKHLKEQKKGTTRIYTGFFLFFLLTALGYVFYGVKIYFWYLYSTTGVLKAQGFYLVNNIGLLLFIYAFSSISLVLGSKRTFLPGLVILLALPILFCGPLWVFNILDYLIIPLSIIFFVIFLNFIFITKRRLRRNFFSIFLGFILLLGGCITSTQILDPFIQLIDYPITEGFMLISLILIGFGFTSISSLKEAFPAAFIEELYLIKGNGTILLRYQFRTQPTNISKENPPQMDEETFASSVLGIEEVLREISSAQGLLKTVVHQSKILIVERASQIMGVFLTRVELGVLRSHLLNLLLEVETNFLNEIQTQETLAPSSRAILIAKASAWFKDDLRKVGDLTLKDKPKPTLGRLFKASNVIFEKFPVRISPIKFLSIYIALIVIQVLVLVFEIKGSAISISQGLLGLLLLNGVFLVFYLINKYLVRAYNSNVDAIFKNIRLQSEGIELAKEQPFPYRALFYAYLVGCLVVLPLTFIVCVILLNLIMSFIIIAGKFVIFDGILTAEFSVNLAKFLRVNLFLHEMSQNNN